jgi:hypothetical protein
MIDWLHEKWFGFPVFMGGILGAVGLMVGGLFYGTSFLVDCDAMLARWEAAEEACEERGGHWRSRPASVYCDGAYMLEPRGECWGDMGLDVELGGGEP